MFRSYTYKSHKFPWEASRPRPNINQPQCCCLTVVSGSAGTEEFVVSQGQKQELILAVIVLVNPLSPVEKSLCYFVWNMPTSHFHNFLTIKRLFVCPWPIPRFTQFNRMCIDYWNLWIAINWPNVFSSFFSWNFYLDNIASFCQLPHVLVHVCSTWFQVKWRRKTAEVEGNTWMSQRHNHCYLVLFIYFYLFTSGISVENAFVCTLDANPFVQNSSDPVWIWKYIFFLHSTTNHFLHPSIFYRLSWVRLQGQQPEQWSPDFTLPIPSWPGNALGCPQGIPRPAET